MKEYGEIVNKLRELIVQKLEIDLSSSELKESTPLIEYGLGVDSVSTMEFIVVLENEFEIEIDESEVDQSVFRSIKTVADFISERLNES